MDHAEAAKQRGNDLYKAKKFAEAIAAYDEAIKAFPNELTYYSNKAAALLEDGQTDRCIATLKEALDRKAEIYSINKEGASYEKVSKAYCRLATAYLKLHKYDEAITAYQKALTENNDKTTRNLLREAEAARDKYVKEQYINPAKGEEHRERGNALFKETKYFIFIY